MIMTINSKNPQPRLIGKVIEVLEQGGVIVYPTDTVYGVGCDLFNQEAIRKVHRLKKELLPSVFIGTQILQKNLFFPGIEGHDRTGNKMAVYRGIHPWNAQYSPVNV